VRLRAGRLVTQRTLARASVGLTLALLLAGGLLAGTQYIPSPQQQQMVTTSSAVDALALTADGDLLASVIGGWNAQVQLRDGTTGALLDTLEIGNRHTFVGRLVFAPGGDVLAVGLLDRVQLWDVPSGTHITTLATTTWWGYPYIAFAPDGRMLVLGGVTSDGRRVLETYDLTDGTTRTVGMRPTGEGELHAVAFTSDGTTVRVAWRDGTIQAWNPATGALEQSYTLYAAYPQMSPHQLMGQIVLSPDGTYAATHLFDQPLTVAVWQLDGEEARLLHTLEGHVGFMGVPAFSPDGQLLAIGDQDRLVRVWDVADGSLHTALRGHWDGAMHLALTNDGWLATGGQDFTLRLWDVAVGE
jgi:WD40 repeat protein